MLNFNCGNNFMTKDLQSTLRCKDFANSHVTKTDIEACNTDYKCKPTFLITNQTLIYKGIILYKLNNKIQGTVHLNFSDIDLEPPVKMVSLT